MKKIIFPVLCLMFMACDMGQTAADKSGGGDSAAQLKQINAKLDKISMQLAALQARNPQPQIFPSVVRQQPPMIIVPPKEPPVVAEPSIDDIPLSVERAKAKAAYNMVANMLEDAVAYNKRTGRPPSGVSQLDGNYKMDGFRADVNYNGPSLFRVKNGRDVYRIHFIAPYSYHYNAYPDIRKICDSDFKDYFANVCGYLAGKDMSKAEKNEYGYFRLGLD